jgi:hypothetical protein
MKLINIKDWKIGINYSIKLFEDYGFSGPIEYNFRNFTLNTGIEIKKPEQEDERPVLNIYKFFLYEGDS